VSDAGKKKARPKTGWRKTPPPLPCETRSFEHVLLHVEFAGQHSTSSKGAPAAIELIPGSFIITVQGLLPITNRAGKMIF